MGNIACRVTPSCTCLVLNIDRACASAAEPQTGYLISFSVALGNEFCLHFPSASSFYMICTQSRTLSLSPLHLCLSDFMIKVIEVMDSSQQKTLRGHDAPVLSVTFDPTDDYVVSGTDICNAEYFFLLSCISGSVFIRNDPQIR